MVECVCLACRIEKSWEEGEGQEKQTPTLLQGRLCGRNHGPATERLRQEDVLSPGIPGHPLETLSHKEQNKTLEAQPPSLSLWRKSHGYPAETVFAPLRRVRRQPLQGWYVESVSWGGDSEVPKPLAGLSCCPSS